MRKATSIFLSTDESYNKLFTEIKSEFLKLDPVSFTENYLKLDGKPFKVSGSGWRFMSDIYRYIATKAIQPDGKPIVILKGRQVGATVMAAALDLYFTASGLFGGNGKDPITILHCFPALALAQRFSQTKLSSLIDNSTNDYINQQKLGYNPKTKRVSSSKPDNMTLKQFRGGCNLWIESIGEDGDRIIGISNDGIMFDECFPYDQHIEMEGGKQKIGSIVKDFEKLKPLPRVKTYNEETEKFEYKQITNAWNRGEKPLLQITCGNREIRCTTNHRFLTENGWIEAGQLKVGSMIKTSHSTEMYVRAPNDDQKQIILGSFLGDGHVRKYGTNKFRLGIIHCIEQSEYCYWKASMLDSSVKSVLKNGYSQKPAITFRTKMFGMNGVFPATKTTCPQWVLDQIDARGIAVWFMDDGSTQYWNGGALACLSTCSFDEESQKRIVEKFKTFGIECHYKAYDVQRNGYTKQFFSVYFNKDGFFNLCKLIRPYMNEGMSYKIPDFNKNDCSYNWDNDFKVYGLAIVDKITILEKMEEVYDIEVEDNHNFILSPSATSKNLGGLIAHNCQNMSATAIGITLKTLTHAKYGPKGTGIQVYFGTPRARGSYFEIGLWNQTDKRYYFLGCTNKSCNHYFMLSTPGSEEWQKIWLFDQTIKCPECGAEEDKRILVENGKWIATEPFNKDGTEKPFVGFHISQLYVPVLDKKYILNQKPENNPASSERIYYNEVLGEFYSGSDMPISRDEIYDKCRDADRNFSKIILPSERKTWLGIDWGGKVDMENSSRGQSYSCAVVLSADSTGTLNVEFAYKMKSTDLQYQMDFVRQMFKNYGLKLAVADIGFGQQQCAELQKIYGSKFLSCMASAQQKKSVTYDAEQLQLKWNKDHYIEEVYDLMRSGKIRFPWKSYEHIDWLIDHITSMEIEHSYVNGMPKKIYKKGPTPNDGFMSLIHAYLAYKFSMTEGFSFNPNNPSQIGKPPSAVLAYMPKIR